jgi:hypothetical protein
MAKLGKILYFVFFHHIFFDIIQIFNGNFFYDIEIFCIIVNLTNNMTVTRLYKKLHLKNPNLWDSKYFVLVRTHFTREFPFSQKCFIWCVVTNNYLHYSKTKRKGKEKNLTLFWKSVNNCSWLLGWSLSKLFLSYQKINIKSI